MLRKLRAVIQPMAPAESSASPASQLAVVMLGGGFEVRVVGESYYQDALTAIVGGKGPESVRIPTQATLVPEPDNPYDPNAVAVYIAAGRSGTFHDRPPRPSLRWAGDSPDNNRSALVRRPLPAAGTAGTATRDTSASSSTWPIPTSCRRATDYESLPRRLWRCPVPSSQVRSSVPSG
jgi:hypothetical protein